MLEPSIILCITWISSQMLGLPEAKGVMMRLVGMGGFKLDDYALIIILSSGEDD